MDINHRSRHTEIRPAPPVGTFVPEYRYAVPTPEAHSQLDDVEDREDIDTMIALGLHLSD